MNKKELLEYLARGAEIGGDAPTFTPPEMAALLVRTLDDTLGRRLTAPELLAAVDTVEKVMLELRALAVKRSREALAADVFGQVFAGVPARRSS